ncbi:MAG: MarR family transcriptional regulator [Sphingomonadales bacterium]|nr:MarR family transcriptional regulator [Sphingomonadales bacterium]
MAIVKRVTKERNTESGGEALSADASTSLDNLDKRRQRWIREGLNFDFDFVEFVSGITIIDQLIEREFKRIAQSQFGMTTGDLRILFVLRQAEGDGALRPSDLFKRLLVTSGAVTKQLDRLEARKLVRRVFNSAGKRGWLVLLTSEGQVLTDAAIAAVSTLPIASRAFHALGAADRAHALQCLHVMIREIEQHTRLDPID